jgi:hypothetical protein
MPRPFRGVITGRSSDATLIRADKDRFIRQLYAQLGPEAFWRRRLEWLAAHGRWTSYHRLIAYLERAGIDILPPS